VTVTSYMLTALRLDVLYCHKYLHCSSHIALVLM